MAVRGVVSTGKKKKETFKKESKSPSAGLPPRLTGNVGGRTGYQCRKIGRVVPTVQGGKNQLRIKFEEE